MSRWEQIKRNEQVQRIRPAYDVLRYSSLHPPRRDTGEMARIRRARDHGGRWLLYRTRSDGSTQAVYYKVLNALQVCGESRAANRLCNWIVANEMTAEGDFGRNPAQKKNGDIYKNAWLIIGCQRLARYEVARHGMDFILRFHDPISGGFYSSRTAQDENSEQELKVVGYCGLAALATGRVEIACAVGRWFRMLMQAQPGFPQKLYTVYSRAQGLHSAPVSQNPWRYVIASDTPDHEYFAQIGIAAAHLARLYQATGEAEWLTLAKEYMRFAEVASDALFDSIRAGKVGWAATLLYTLTGEPKYNSMALRVAGMLLAKQAHVGSWNAPEAQRPDIDVSAEMVVMLDEIYQGVASH